VIIALLRRLLILVVLVFGATAQVIAHELPLDKLNLQDGFKISVYAELVNPRQLARSPSGIIFAGSMRAGNLYALIDKDGDHTAETIITLDTDLELPTGIAYRDGDLFVGAVGRILVYKNIEDRLYDQPEPEVVYGDLPTEQHHGWKYLGFGPDEQLYFNVGAPCNICLSEDPRFATIMRVDLSKQPLMPEIYASGIRNSVGFDWNPQNGELWFTENGRDMLGDEFPPCELNRAPKPGLHFGYPFIHGEAIHDPEFGSTPVDQVPPAIELGPHVAPLGMLFYTGDMFPPEYKGKILLAEHGSWNRSEDAGHVGYRIMMADPVSGEATSFIDGWLQDNVGWGRPADLLQLPDGSVLVADDHGNVIYRVTYQTPQKP
jgi:glucose/arabinose dehydrogenase